LLKQYNDLPGWTFEALEVSNGAWRVSGIHDLGPSVETTDSDLESAMQWCRDSAHELQKEIPRT
jgi:hypothetical protein